MIIGARSFFKQMCVFVVLFKVLEAFSKAEKIEKANPEELFQDVYKEMPRHLERQRMEMKDHTLQYGEHYPQEGFEKIK